MDRACSHRRASSALAFAASIALAACAPRAEPAAHVDVPAPIVAPAASAGAAPPAAAKSGAAGWQAQEVLVEGPQRILSIDTAGGIGCSYEAIVELDRNGETFDGHCTLRVHADDPNGTLLPVRLAEKDVTVPAERVRRFTSLLRHAVLSTDGRIRLAELDSFESTELYLYPR